MRPAPKALLATFGTLGDIYPFIAMASAIKARGIEAVIAAPEDYRGAIDAEGIAFAAIRPGLQDVCAALGVDVPGAYRIMLGNPHFILDEIYMRFLAETYEDVLRAAADADVILTHSLLVGAHLAAEKLCRPSARAALAPLHLQSAMRPSLTPSAPYILQPCVSLATRYNGLVRSIVRASVGMRMNRLRTFRQTVGLPRTKEDLFLDFGKANGVEKVFGLFSPAFAPAQPDQPRNLEVTGFPFFHANDERRSRLNPSLVDFLAAGSPPIVFTLGSFAPEVSGTFYDVSIRAARAVGRRSVLLAGAHDANRLRDMAGPDVFVCASAPHGLLFPKSLCVVHHGGIGTTGEALRAGKPQIVVPFFGDQPDHAARVRRLGVGLSLNLSRYDERRSTDALRLVIGDDLGRRAEAFATSIDGERGVEIVADWVEAKLRAQSIAA